MKKFMSIVLAVTMILSLSAMAMAEAPAQSFKVAIVQQLSHPSLDEIRVAIEAELTAAAEEKGITIEYKSFDGATMPPT